MRIRNWKIALLFLLFCGAVESCFGATSCETPLFPHADASDEREYQNIYQCITAPDIHNTSISTSTIFFSSTTNASVSSLTVTQVASISSLTVTGTDIISNSAPKLTWNNTVPATGNLASVSWRMSTNGASTNRYVLRDETTSTDILLIDNSDTYGIGSIQGNISGVDAPAGNVGESVSSIVSGVSVGGNGAWKAVTSINLTAGTWIIFGAVVVQAFTTVTGPNVVYSGLTNDGSDLVIADNGMYFSLNNTASEGSSAPFWTLKTSTSKTVYLTSFYTYSAGAPTQWGALKAKRIM